MHILSADQFDEALIKQIFKRADWFKKQHNSIAGKKRLIKLHAGRQVATVFFQPSTRTRLSFEAAAVKLGAGLVSTENAREHSSSVKNETLEDMIRVIDGYSFDAIVIRHHEEGAAARAAKVSKTPIINAGDGAGEHPTQALLDAYTIYSVFGRLNDLNIIIGGDLRYGRTVRSLSKLLSKYPDNKITYVSVPELQVNDDVKRFLRKSGTKFTETSDVGAALKSADVVYWTRLQKEYLKGPKKISAKFSLDKKLINLMKKDSIVMHPLPRVDEIKTEVDNDPRARYFEQAANGLYIRMALIDRILNGKNL